MSAVVVIRQPAELEALRRRRGRTGIQRVILELPGPQAEIRSAERRINAGLHACGCDIGAAFVLVGAAVIVVDRLVIRVATAPLGIADVAQAVGILMAFALAGKIVGIAIAEWRLRSALRQLAGGAWGQTRNPRSGSIR